MEGGGAVLRGGEGCVDVCAYVCMCILKREKFMFDAKKAALFWKSSALAI